MLHFKTNGPASKRFPTRINQIINFHERVSKSRQSGVATTWLSTRINHPPNFHERVSKSRQSGVATKRLSTNRLFNLHERVPKMPSIWSCILPRAEKSKSHIAAWSTGGEDSSGAGMPSNSIALLDQSRICLRSCNLVHLNLQPFQTVWSPLWTYFFLESTTFTKQLSCT